jgi:hypothetical protein
MILILSSPASAEEKTIEERMSNLEKLFGAWTFYGSARFSTFYEKSDNDFASDTDGVTKVNSGPAITGPDQKTTQWALANNSRLGAAVKRDELGGRIELGLKNDGSVGLRLGYGTYTAGDVTFLIGQDYTPLSDWDYSNQVFNADNNLAGWGVIDMDGKRIPQVKVSWKGLQVALVQNKKADALNLPSDAKATTDILMPVLEARYRYSYDKFFGDLFGGFSSYKVKSDSLDINETVTSCAAGLGGGVKLAFGYVKAMAWMARNGKQMGLHQADSAGATFDLNDHSLIDDKDFGWTLISGVYIGKATCEAGYGYVSSERDTGGVDRNEARNYYVNAAIPVAQSAIKGVSFIVVPEVGVFDYMKNEGGADQGKIMYAGLKWQISF